MTIVFADTFYYFALVNPADDRHKQANEFTAGFAGKIVTSAWVLTEVGDGLAKAVNRPLFLELVSDLRTDPDVQVVPPDLELFDAGLSLYQRRLERECSGEESEMKYHDLV